MNDNTGDYEVAKGKKEDAGFKTKLTKSRDTKNTFVFKNETDGAPIPSLYIAKSAFDGEAPESITVEVTGN